MDSTDKHIKDLYKSAATTSVPDDLSWDKVQAGIYDKMPRKRRWPVMWLILGFGILIGFGIANLFEASDSDKIALHLVETQVSETKDRITSINTSAASGLEAAPSKSQESLNAGQDGLVSTASTIEQVSKPSRRNSDKFTSAESTTTNAGPELGASLTPMLQGTTLAQSDQSISSSMDSDAVVVKDITPALATLPYTPALVSSIAELELTDGAYTEVRANYSPQTIWRITPIVGANRNLDRYTDYASMERAISNEWGWTAGVLAARPIGRGPLFLEVGLLTEQRNQRVEHQGIDKVRIDTSIMVRSINSLNGEVLHESMVDTVMQVSRHRTLAYTNTAQRLSLRTSMGRTLGITNRLQANVAMGLQVDRLLYERGYYLDEATEYRFAGQDRRLYRQWSTAVVPSLSVEYALTDRLALYTGCTASLGLTNGSSIPEARLQLGSVGVMTGLTFLW